MTNKTTKICCTLALLASVAATPAFSQAKNFAGPSIAISGAFNSGDVKGTAQTDTENASSNFGKSNIIPGIDLSYGIPIDNNFLVNIGATYDLSKSTLADARASLDPDEDDETPNETYTTKLTIKDHYSFYIQPTYLVSNASAIFAKLSYNFAKGSYTETGTDLTPTSFTVSRNIEGFGYGIGLKSLLNNNLYVQVEAGIDEYDKESATDSGNAITYTIDPKVVTGKISIGYKF
jgi:hypothetical protein